MKLTSPLVSVALVVLAGCGSSEDAPAQSVQTADAGVTRTSGASGTSGVGVAVSPAADAGSTPATDSGASADAATDAGPSFAFDIPVTTVYRASDGTPFVTTMVSVGGSPPIVAVVDTGSVGLRVVTGAVDPKFWTDSGNGSGPTTYGGVYTVNGEIVSAVVTVGGVSTNGPINFQDVTDVDCTASAPGCAQGNQPAASYLFVDIAPAILGVGTRVNENFASPLAAMGAHGQYIFSLDALGAKTGALHIDPSAAEIARFAANVVPLTSNGVTSAGGVAGWDDTAVPFCLNAYCDTAILDCGAGAYQILISDPADDTAIGAPAGSTTIPSGVAVKETLATSAVTTFTVGATPVAGADLVRLGAGARGSGKNNLGITPFFQDDVMYDYRAGTIGIAPKE